MHNVFPIISWILPILLLDRSSWRFAKNFLSNGSLLFSLICLKIWEIGEERKRRGLRVGGGGWCGGVCLYAAQKVSIKGAYAARTLSVRSRVRRAS